MVPNILYWGDDPPAEWQPLAKYKEHAESFNRQNAAELGDSTVPDVIATADWYTP